MQVRITHLNIIGEKTMNSTSKISFLSTALAIPALRVVANQTPVSRPATGRSIQDRKETQQDRVANGVKSGQLTAGETSTLEKKEAAVNQEERHMRKLDNGKLTPADKKTLTQ